MRGALPLYADARCIERVESPLAARAIMPACAD